MARSVDGQRGIGQIRGKVKEGKIGIGIADGRGLSSEAGEEDGSKQIGRILNQEAFRQNKARSERNA